MGHLARGIEDQAEVRPPAVMVALGIQRKPGIPPLQSEAAFRSGTVTRISILLEDQAQSEAEVPARSGPGESGRQPPGPVAGTNRND